MAVTTSKSVAARRHLVHQAHLPLLSFVARWSLIAGAAALLLVNLTTWPLTWFDEGLNVSASATLATTHLYGLPDSAGIRVMDPAIQTGPVVLIPIAAAFKLFGVGLLQARLVMLGFAIFALVSYFLLARRIAGQVAPVAIALLLLGNGNLFASFVPLARQVLGEVTALGFFCLGSWLWMRRRAPGSGWLLASAGVGALYGLGMVTKSQLAITLPVALGLFWIANLLYYRALPWWSPIVVVAVAIACVLVWYGIQLTIAGPAGVARNSAVLREGFAIHIASLSLAGPRTALGVLWRTGFLWWGIPGLLYGVARARKQNPDGLAWFLPLTLIGTWLGWYVCLSIGWDRYAALPLMLVPLYTAPLLAALVRGQLPLARWVPAPWQSRVGLGAVLLLLVIFGRPLALSVFGPQDTGAMKMAAFLREQVPADAVVETWAWELSILAPQQFHYPDTHITNLYTLKVLRGQSVPEGSYDPLGAAPDYLLTGAMSNWVGIYDRTMQQAEFVAEFGHYALFRIKKSASSP